MTELVRHASVRMAALMDRRHFVRRMAGGTFAGVAALAAGRLVSPAVAFAYPSNCEPTKGSGCPKGCGPSTCCYNESNSSCRCSNGKGGCNNGGCCGGNYNDWGTTNCWTCTYDECMGECYYKVATTCCDCATHCSCPSSHCIAFSTTYTFLGGCPKCPNSDFTPGQVVGVTYDDPANSWGFQPQLQP